MIIMPKFVFYLIFCLSDQRICSLKLSMGRKTKDVYVNVNLSDIVRRQKQAGIMDMIHFRAQAVMYRFERKKSCPIVSCCCHLNLYYTKHVSSERCYHPPAETQAKNETNAVCCFLLTFERTK